MKMNMHQWRRDVITRKDVIAIPVMTHPGIDAIGHSVREAITTGTIQAKAIKYLADHYRTGANCTAMDLTVEELEELFETAEDIIENGEKYAHCAEGRVMGTLFYEPSTRTRLSFTAAMMELRTIVYLVFFKMKHLSFVFSCYQRKNVDCLTCFE